MAGKKTPGRNRLKAALAVATIVGALAGAGLVSGQAMARSRVGCAVSLAARC